MSTDFVRNNDDIALLPPSLCAQHDYSLLWATPRRGIVRLEGLQFIGGLAVAVGAPGKHDISRSYGDVSEEAGDYAKEHEDDGSSLHPGSL